MSNNNQIPPTGSHRITLQTAIEMTTRYRQHRETMLDPQFRNQNILPLSETFNRADIDALLSQEGCAGLRVYLGMDSELKIHSILEAVTANNEDRCSQADQMGGEEDIILELAQRCPDLCPPASPLNS